MRLFQESFDGNITRVVRQITSIRKFNSKFYVGECVVREGVNYYLYPFVLNFCGHFADIPCDLHFALENSNFDLVMFNGCGYEKYFDGKKYQSVIVAQMNV